MKACQMCRPPGGTVLTKIITKRSPNVKCAHHRVIEISREKREVDPNRKCWSIMENSGIESAYFPYATAHRFESNKWFGVIHFLRRWTGGGGGLPKNLRFSTRGRGGLRKCLHRF